MSSNVRVCKEWFPNAEHPENSGFLMEEQLKIQIDVLLKNITRDWDFTIIITGQGEVRVGKSMIAMQIAAYWNYMVWKLHKVKNPFSVQENMVFEGKKLIEIGNKLGKNNPYSVLIYDEAGADLEGRKVMQTATQEVLDYYRECGQYNMLNILVLPEYFDLPKGLALSRSIFLIDVYYSADQEGVFKRGYFNFFSRRQKKWLYLLGKKDLNYNAVKYDFNGKFPAFYVINEEDYRVAKQEALSKRESKKRNKFQMQRDASWYLLNRDFSMTQEKIAQRMEQLTGIFIARETISDGLAHFKMENE